MAGKSLRPYLELAFTAILSSIGLKHGEFYHTLFRLDGPVDYPSLRCLSDKRSWYCGVAERILTSRTERLKPSVDTQTKWLQELVAEIFSGAGRLNQPIHIPLRKADEHLWSPVLLRQKYLHFIEDYRI